MTKITGLRTVDVRFPTSQSLDGSDAMNPDPDYSAAYVVLETDGSRVARRTPLAHGVHNHSHHDHYAGDDAFTGLTGANLRQTSLKHGNDEHAKKGVDDRAAPAHEAGAADHHSGNHLQLHA